MLLSETKIEGQNFGGLKVLNVTQITNFVTTFGGKLFKVSIFFLGHNFVTLNLKLNRSEVTRS